MRREFLQLADTYNPSKHKIAGWYCSEKLDGTRCWYDGGLTRGMPTRKVPWANVLDPKTGKPKSKVKPFATGLWSRYGNPIMAPDWFLNQLPSCPLDGELWAGRGNFQLCRSICAGDEPDARFDQISYAVYSAPSIAAVLNSGEIKNANMLATFDSTAMQEFVLKRIDRLNLDYRPFMGGTFEEELAFLRTAISAQDRVYMHKQTRLPPDEATARSMLDVKIDKVLDLGGEGLILRDPTAQWTPKRHKGILKFKPFEDAEAEVVGYVAGREGKQGNVLGKIGALKVRTTSLETNVEFEIGSGLTFEQREFATYIGSEVARGIPGEPMPWGYSGKHIKLGDVITFKFRELSDDGVPKESRFWRLRGAE